MLVVPEKTRSDWPMSGQCGDPSIGILCRPRTTIIQGIKVLMRDIWTVSTPTPARNNPTHTLILCLLPSCHGLRRAARPKNSIELCALARTAPKHQHHAKDAFVSSMINTDLLGNGDDGPCEIGRLLYKELTQTVSSHVAPPALFPQWTTRLLNLSLQHPGLDSLPPLPAGS